MGRRESDNCAILFSKLGISCVQPDPATIFKSQKRFLKWICAEVFGVEAKYFAFNPVRFLASHSLSSDP